MSRRSGGTDSAPSDSTTAPEVTRPELSGSSPAIMRSVVVLPQPLGPISDTRLPAATSMSIPCTAVKAP